MSCMQPPQSEKIVVLSVVFLQRKTLRFVQKLSTAVKGVAVPVIDWLDYIVT